MTLYVGWGPTGNTATCSALCQLLVTSNTTHHKLGPSGVDSRVYVCVYVLGPCVSLQQTLLLAPQPPQFFSIRGLRLYFPALEPWVALSVLLPSCSSRFICTQMWDRLVYQLPSCHESSLPGCLSPALLLAWMNVSSSTPWLSDFHTVRFSVSSVFFFFF